MVDCRETEDQVRSGEWAGRVPRAPRASQSQQKRDDDEGPDGDADDATRGLHKRARSHSGGPLWAGRVECVGCQAFGPFVSLSRSSSHFAPSCSSSSAVGWWPTATRALVYLGGLLRRCEIHKTPVRHRTTPDDRTVREVL